MKTGIGQIVHVKEFPARGSRSPDGDFGEIIFRSFVKTAKEGREDMGIFGMVIVARSVEICWHSGVKKHAMLLSVILAKFEAGDLGDCVSLVCRFERAFQQARFGHRLRGMFWVNT